MSKSKKVPFADALAIWAETASEQEIRDGVTMLSVYARQRKFGFTVRVETIKSVGAAIIVSNLAKEEVLHGNRS